MFIDKAYYIADKVNNDVKNSDEAYTVSDIVDLLPGEVIINLHSGSYDTKLHRILCSSLSERFKSDCSCYKNLIVKDTNLDKDYENFEDTILIIEI